jgi:hypothetical protein
MTLGWTGRHTVFHGAFREPQKSDRRRRPRRHALVPRACSRQIIAGMMAALVCGCAVVPDFAPPVPPDVSGYTPGRAPARTVAADVSGGQAQRFAKGRDIPGDWWRLFSSQPLKTLIERALKNNADLATAQAALRVSQANLAAGKGAYFPSIDGNFLASRQMAPTAPPAPDENCNLVLPETPA